MSGRRVLLLAVAVAAVVTVVTAGTKPGFAECTHNDDCGPLSCCLLGRMRYSIPSCAPLGTVGSYCYADSQPSSHGLHYPGDVYLELEAAHLGMCPCEPGLVCYRGMCQLEHEVPSQSREHNSVSLEN